MVLTDTGRLSACPCCRDCTGSILTPSDDVAFITTIVKSLWKGKALCKSLSVGQWTRIFAYYIYKNSIRKV